VSDYAQKTLEFIVPETSFFDWVLLIALALQWPAVIFFIPLSIAMLFLRWYEDLKGSSLLKKVLYFYGLVILPTVILGFGFFSFRNWLDQMMDKL